ncbi:MAG: glycerate kinase, partial [Burkholderiaceae bacterium]|nr:glycerate kinase [Burkholderiaceae bacterium]
MTEPRALLRRMFDAAIDAAQPARCIPPQLPDPRAVRGRIVVIGAGKASAEMARVVEQAWAGSGVPLTGLVVTRYGYGAACTQVEIVEAAHPVPDAAGLAAAQRMLQRVAGLRADDLVLCLISGGGSALLPLPLPGLTLDDKQALNREGGRLAAACHPAQVLTLALSDVPGDDPINIASGLTVADPTTCADALAIVRRYAIALPPQVQAVLDSGRGESIKPGDARLERSELRLAATPYRSLEAAAEVARAAGVTPLILGDSIEGEARDVGKVLGGIARSAALHGGPAAAPCVLLSGGETTVTVRGSGRGGRNVEFALSLALSLDGLPGVWALAGDTDGVDGAEEVAGAVITPDTLARAWALGLRAADRLADNDGHGFFAALDDQVITGPTRTN